MSLKIYADRGYFRIIHSHDAEIVITTRPSSEIKTFTRKDIFYVHPLYNHILKKTQHTVFIPYPRISVFLHSKEKIIRDLPEYDTYVRGLLVHKESTDLETEGYCLDVKISNNPHIQRLLIAKTDQEPEFNLFLDYNSREIKVLSKDQELIDRLKGIAEGIIMYYEKIHQYNSSKDDNVRKNLSYLAKDVLVKKITELGYLEELEKLVSIKMTWKEPWLLPIGYDASLEYGLLYSKGYSL